MKKCILLAFLFLSGLGWQAGAQQLTRFAVVDISKVYSAFFRESRAVREFEEQSSRIQADIDRMTREIQELKVAQFNAESRGDRNQSIKLEGEAYQKSEYLKEYFKIKTAELEDRKKKLTESETFLNQISNEIRLIAESEGYSMVLKTNKEILWYSPSVDITDKLIQNLHAKAGRR